MRTLFAFLVLTLAAWGANVKLYLKDGTFQIVREYKVENDRVSFYSIERSEWEEMPLDLVDLKRTDAEAASRQSELQKQSQVLAEEEKAERDLLKEASRIPQDPGVYWLDGNKTNVIKPAASTVHTDKGRSVLQVLTPVPMVSGRGTLEVNGAHSQNIFTNPEQEFYIELSATERFGVAKVTSKGSVRIIESLSFEPVTHEVTENADMVDIFREQLTSDELYKIWPKQPLEPGEYAVVQYTEGTLDIQVWDFAIRPVK
jgi:hypothetical protein